MANRCLACSLVYNNTNCTGCLFTTYFSAANVADFRFLCQRFPGGIDHLRVFLSVVDPEDRIQWIGDTLAQYDVEQYLQDNIDFNVVANPVAPQGQVPLAQQAPRLVQQPRPLALPWPLPPWAVPPVAAQPRPLVPLAQQGPPLVQQPRPLALPRPLPPLAHPLPLPQAVPPWALPMMDDMPPRPYTFDQVRFYDPCQYVDLMLGQPNTNLDFLEGSVRSMRQMVMDMCLREDDALRQLNQRVGELTTELTNRLLPVAVRADLENQLDAVRQRMALLSRVQGNEGMLYLQYFFALRHIERFRGGV